MSAWQGLLKKEFRLGRTWLFTGLLLLIPAVMVNYYFADVKEGIIAFAALLIGLHFFYMAVYMFSSLNLESDKLQLWLQNPQPARNLLLAKLLNGLFSMLVSLTVVSLFTLTIVKVVIEIPVGLWDYIWELGIFIYLNIVAASVYSAMWVVLAWTVYRVLKNLAGRWAWLGVIGVLIIPTPILEKFSETKIYHILTNWGPIELDSLQRIQQLSSEIPNITTSGSVIPPLGYYVFHLVIVILIFFLSSWLLDNKVEV